MRYFFYIILQSLIPLTTIADSSVDILIKNLYSDDFKTRSTSAGKLSSLKSQKEISEISKKFKDELLCIQKKPLPKACHDPKFIYNAILVAGNLSVHSQEAWDFLIYLSEGNSNLDGSFFLEPSEDAFREVLYKPFKTDLKPTRQELEAFLQETIKKADIRASCDWKLDKIKKFSKKKEVFGYQVYHYERGYSEGLLPQYQIWDVMTWIYNGERRISCGPVYDLFMDEKTKEVFAFTFSDESGESLELNVSLSTFPDVKELCSYTIRYDGGDPLNASSLKINQFFRTFFDYDSKTCRPKNISGYEFIKLP